MRHVLLAAAAIAFAAPGAVFAQSSPSFPDEMDGEIARSLPHPYDVEEAGEKLERTVDALLDVPIGGVIRSVDPSAGVRRDETIGDYAGQDDPEFESRIQDDVRGMTLKTADLMRQLAIAAPALRRSLADLERNLSAALDERRPDEDRRRRR